ncbi:MAG: AAA family ATPase [Sulfurovum sp.]|nr:AAA family ATPase [Sulfurovum sp.]
MFGDILKIVTQEVNAYIDLDSQLPAGTKIVILDKPHKSDGEFAIIDNSISLSLLNIEEEISNMGSIVNKTIVDGKVYKQNPDITINLQVIFISNFKNDYITELNYLTKVVKFFQQKPFFSIENTSSLEKLGIDKINFKLKTIPLNEQSNIWGLLGGKYMPSLLYTISMIVIKDQEKISDLRLVKEVNNSHIYKENPMNNVLGQELAWIKNLIENRIANYFQEDISLIDDTRDFNLSPSYYADFIAKYNLDLCEQKVVTLALASYLSPSILDIFLSKNTLYDTPFTEFGGLSKSENRGFIPTIETALFLLAGNDLTVTAIEQRIQVLKLFENSSTLYHKNILDTTLLKKEESKTSTRLALSPNSLNFILFGKEIEHQYSTHFPASRMETKYEWDDLILPEYTREHLLELDMWLKHKDTLLNEWGMRGMIQKGYKALFYGLPGTGKTLTVSLLAKRYNRAVYRVNLSKIVSKYIGETEKNLEYIFDIAEKEDWILFFDEADSLFSKRTQISSSNDKHANQETAYLLQKIEECHGLVILASNLKDNFDDAFLRRFQTIVYFPPYPTIKKD